MYVGHSNSWADVLLRTMIVMKPWNSLATMMYDKTFFVTQRSVYAMLLLCKMSNSWSRNGRVESFM